MFACYKQQYMAGCSREDSSGLPWSRSSRETGTVRWVAGLLISFTSMFECRLVYIHSCMNRFVHWNYRSPHDPIFIPHRADGKTNQEFQRVRARADLIRQSIHQESTEIQRLNVVDLHFAVLFCTILKFYIPCTGPK